VNARITAITLFVLVCVQMAGLGLKGSQGRDVPAFCQQQFHSLQRGQLVRRNIPRNLQRDALVLSIQPNYGPEHPLQQPYQQPLQPLQPDAEQSSSSKQAEKEKPLVRVQLSVQYRVHSRQMLCVGGSQIPFGWSFLSIAKVPMTWNQGDVWTCEVKAPAALLLYRMCSNGWPR
jgi:hypothetical protein